MIRIFNDLESLSQAAAEIFLVQSRQATMICGRFAVALSGGSTPRRLFEILATPPYQERVHWNDVHIFWSDERCVPGDDLRNNANLARQVLLRHVPIPETNIHPIQTDLPPREAAESYEQELREFFSRQNPNFHLIYLGLGTNGHTASLFPYTAVLGEQARWVSAVHIREQNMDRVTFTAPFINQASQVVFMVSGLDKAKVLEKVLEGPFQPRKLPAQLIRPNGSQPIWLVDKIASRKLISQNEEDLLSEGPTAM